MTPIITPFLRCLGNWSFGDYFKKEAIEWAWELLTEVYKIDKDILYVTVFEGSTADGTTLDSEAYDIWKNLIPEDRILTGNKDDNFWEMGEQGPCGPCSEIHVDIRSKEEKEKISGHELINKDHPQVVEIWNLVFMEFNRKANGSLEPLPQKHIDTGMGFERLCMVLQNVTSNYDTDVFTPIIREIEAISGQDYGKQFRTRYRHSCDFGSCKSGGFFNCRWTVTEQYGCWLCDSSNFETGCALRFYFFRS